MNTSRLRAFGGGQLVGRKVVRFVFLDEAGTSAKERYAVVGGVIVHGDNQLIPLEERLAKVIADHIPEEDRDEFVLHATDIKSGSRYFKDQDVWPLNRRLAIFEDLKSIPEDLQIPVIFGFVDKKNFKALRTDIEIKPAIKEVVAQAYAYSGCCVSAEGAMREIWSDEVAQIVAEDNHAARNMIKESHRLLSMPHLLKKRGIQDDFLPLQRIRGSPHFADKSESAPLQLADFCAYIIRGHLNAHPLAEIYYPSLQRMMLVLPKGEPPPPR